MAEVGVRRTIERQGDESVVIGLGNAKGSAAEV